MTLFGPEEWQAIALSLRVSVWATVCSLPLGVFDTAEAAALAYARDAREHGVPASRIYVDHAGLRTLDSMRRAENIFKIKEAIVCTQEFHLARSIYLAESYGIDAVGVIADQRVYAKRKANRQREFIARVVAFLDVNVLDRQPRHWGDEIPIDGPAVASHDKSIRAWETSFTKK